MTLRKLPILAVAAVLQAGFFPTHSDYSYAESPPEHAASIERLLHDRESQPAAEIVDSAARSAILKRPDPETFFLYYAFGIRRHSERLLSAEQAAQLNTVIESRAKIGKRWHDERNALRCKYYHVMWQYVGADDIEAERLNAELGFWMKLRMRWTQQEHLAEYRFADEFWNILTSEQQHRLIGGEWKEYAKLDTGHTRSDTTAKFIVKSIGKPDHPKEFDEATVQWSEQRKSLHQTLAQCETEERCVAFAMDRNSEAMVFQACEASTEAYAKLYLTEAASIRQIVHLGYESPRSKCEKAANEAWGEAGRRFTEGAAELIAEIERLQQR